jgi:Anti-sigma-K factor rskA
MNSSLSAAEWSELLAGYVLGDLTAAEMVAVEEYLAGSTAAQAELQQLQATLSLVAEAAPLAVPAIDSVPATLHEVASLEIVRERMMSSVVLPVAQSRRHWLLPWLGWGFGTITAILAATLGWQNYQLDRQLTAAHQEIKSQNAQLQKSSNLLTVAQKEMQHQQLLLRQSGNRLLEIKGLDAGGKSAGSLVLSPAMDTAMLVLQKVPVLPAGKVYRMWAIMGSEEMACADFVPDQSGQVFQQISVKEWKSTKTVVVTIESAKESSIPEGSAVMMGGKEIDL